MSIDPHQPPRSDHPDDLTRTASPGHYGPPSELAPGASIGAYRLLRQIGEGGMGVVYHAQQMQPIRRDVALKVIKPGMNSKEVIARFESERQALAMMDHTNIARVFDAGTTAAGLPYFAMELVDGVPITRYSDTKKLTLRERIELFVPVCQAIQHAHQKGIIHRDIKSSNILVKEEENRIVPKVIDFGLAKALGGQLSEETSMTILGTVVGTFRYMSPEQAELGRRDIDTRSDVYSLGIVLYELLTGMTPLDRDSLANASFMEVLQRIREEEAKPPSLSLRNSVQLSVAADLRKCDPDRLPALLDNELDWITLKAIEKDRTQRYETVNNLARDLQRYLHGDPVEAVPPSTAYRMKKFVRRHRLALATAGVFAALLLAGVLISASMAVRASRAEQQARAVNEFLRNDLLAQAGSSAQANITAKPDPNLTVRVALDRAAAGIEGKFKGQPLLEASIRQTIGDAYLDLGLYSEAQMQTGRALALRQAALGKDHPDSLHSMLRLAQAEEQLGRYTEAQTLLIGLVETESKVQGEDHPDTIAATANLGRLYWQQGKYADAQPVLEKALAGQRRVIGEDRPETLNTMNNLALTYFSQGKYAESQPLFEKVLESRRRLLGESHPSTAISMNNMAGLFRVLGRPQDAEPLYFKTLDVRKRVLGADHPDTITAVYNLGALYQSLERFAEAEPLITQVIDARRRSLGDDHPRTLAATFALAVLKREQHDYAIAESLLSKTFAGRRRALGEKHPDTLQTQLTLGAVQIDQGKHAQAERHLRDVLQAYGDGKTAGWSFSACQSLLGRSLTAQKKYAAAEPLLLEAYRGMTDQRASIPAGEEKVIADTSRSLVQLYREWEKPEKAAEWLQRTKATP